MLLAIACHGVDLLFLLLWQRLPSESRLIKLPKCWHFSACAEFCPVSGTFSETTSRVWHYHIVVKSMLGEIENIAFSGAEPKSTEARRRASAGVFSPQSMVWVMGVCNP